MACTATRRQNGGRLIFCNVEPTVSEVFRASKLEPLFEFVADRAAALEADRPGARHRPRPTSNMPAREHRPTRPARRPAA